MFNTKINFLLVVRDNLPNMLQQRVTMQFIRAFIKPIRNIYGQFQSLSSEYMFRIRFNGQGCYLQKILNIRFDPVLERIHIVDANEPRKYVYSYSMPPGKNRVYHKWLRETNFTIGQFASENGYLFESLSNNQNKAPKASIAAAQSDWQYSTKTRRIVRSTKVGITSRYVVFVPKTLVYDNNEFIAVLNYYRLRGLSYTIKTY